MTCPNCAAAEARATAALEERNSMAAAVADAGERLAAAEGERDALRAGVAALVKWASDKADGTVRYTPEELSRLLALLEERPALALPYSTEGRPAVKSEEGK